MVTRPRKKSEPRGSDVGARWDGCISAPADILHMSEPTGLKTVRTHLSIANIVTSCIPARATPKNGARP